MAKICFLVVKNSKQRIFQRKVNAIYFGRGVIRSVKRRMVLEVFDDYVADWVPVEFYGGRVYSIMPARRIQ